MYYLHGSAVKTNRLKLYCKYVVIVNHIIFIYIFNLWFIIERIHCLMDLIYQNYEIIFVKTNTKSGSTLYIFEPIVRKL